MSYYVDRRPFKPQRPNIPWIHVAQQDSLVQLNATKKVVNVPSWIARQLVDQGQARYAMIRVSHKFASAEEAPRPGVVVIEVVGDDVRGVTEVPRSAWSPRPPGQRT